MLLKRLKIETTNLECGMYVAQLDRPWLETPFLYQGFEIRDDQDLRQLRHYCNHVYVDATRGSLPKDKVLEARGKEAQYASVLAAPATRLAHAESPGMATRLLDAVTRMDRTGTLARLIRGRNYRNLVPTQLEAPRAVQAYNQASAVLEEAVDRMNDGAGLDAGRLRQVATPLVDSILRNQDAMAWLVLLRKRDLQASQRAVGCAVWATVLGRHLGFDRAGLDSLAMGGMLLDIGNTKIPREMLVRAGPLDGVERTIVRKHVAAGLKLVRGTPGLNADAIAMIQHHHERQDGSGYPKGLKGDNLPVFGRIAGLVDCFDAMTTKRPYASARSAYDAVRELNSLSGSVFQKELVEQFVQAVGMFPTGSLVELNTGEVAVVIEQNHVRRLRPKLMLLLDAAKRPLGRHSTLDLCEMPGTGGDHEGCWIVHGLEPGAYGLDPKDYFG